MIVSSFFEGRVRLKANLFRNDEISQALKEVLLATKAVTNVTVNETTGSMLIEYNHLKIPYTKLKKVMPYFEQIKEMYDTYGDESIDEIIRIIKELDVLLSK